jgi:hypothetical protein
LTSRELLRVGASLLLQSDTVEYVNRDGCCHVSALMLDVTQRKRDVLLHVQMREKVIALKNYAHFSAQKMQVDIGTVRSTSPRRG